MNKEEIDYWLRYFSNHNHGFMSEDGKKITLFKVFQELKELENHQKEFIKWLENEKNIYPYDISDYTYEDIINTILSKYYEIIDK